MLGVGDRVKIVSVCRAQGQPPRFQLNGELQATPILAIAGRNRKRQNIEAWRVVLLISVVAQLYTTVSQVTDPYEVVQSLPFTLVISVLLSMSSCSIKPIHGY
jgi:hypothetical protein